MTIERENLTAANIKYLLAVRELHRNRESVRSVDVAELLGISRPSVHTMIETMKIMGLLTKEKRGEIRFTDKGATLADTYSQYYQVICEHLETLFPNDSDIRSAVCAVMAEVPEGGLDKLLA